MVRQAILAEPWIAWLEGPVAISTYVRGLPTIGLGNADAPLVQEDLFPCPAITYPEVHSGGSQLLFRNAAWLTTRPLPRPSRVVPFPI